MQIDAKTRLLGIIGDPVGHSLSPIMHNQAFKSLGLNYVYGAFQVKKENLEDAIKGVRALGLAGINVTIPHKTDVIPYLDSLSREAELIGAVNTVVNRDGKLIGYNTDGYGFQMALQNKAGIHLKGKKVFIFGAGGAARAIAGQSLIAGASSVTVANRTLEKAKSLVEYLKIQVRRIDKEYRENENDDINCNAAERTKLEAVGWDRNLWEGFLSDSDVIVNTTSVGMNGKGDLAGEVPWNSVKKEALFFDAVYVPVETSFLKEARVRGHRTVTGLYMLLYQGAKAFELWAGENPPLEIMEKTILTYLEGKS